jgi:hypothetical protein
MKKYHFDAFQHEKYFKKQSQPHSQTDLKEKREYLSLYHNYFFFTVWFFFLIKVM